MTTTTGLQLVQSKGVCLQPVVSLWREILVHLVSYNSLTLYTLTLLYMHILYTVLYTFPKVLTRRICSTIKRFLSWQSFLLFS